MKGVWHMFCISPYVIVHCTCPRGWNKCWKHPWIFMWLMVIYAQFSGHFEHMFCIIAHVLTSFGISEHITCDVMAKIDIPWIFRMANWPSQRMTSRARPALSACRLRFADGRRRCQSKCGRWCATRRAQSRIWTRGGRVVFVRSTIHNSVQLKMRGTL